MSLWRKILADGAKVEVEWRKTPPLKAIQENAPLVLTPAGLQPLPPKSIVVPEELANFRNHVKSLRLFPACGEEAPARNSWEIRDTEGWLYTNVNELLVGGIENNGVEYLEQCYVLGNRSSNGLEVIAVDTHPERLGWIGFFWYEFNLEEGGFPVVAKSLTEWLERTSSAGPAEYYWEQSSFEDLGPAIPTDPNYRSFPAR